MGAITCFDTATDLIYESCLRNGLTVEVHGTHNITNERQKTKKHGAKCTHMSFHRLLPPILLRPGWFENVPN